MDDIATTGTQCVLPTGADPDDPDAAFALIDSGAREGVAGALLTITGILDGAPRAVGTQMAVLADGRYCGQISGGCVESAVASASLRCLARGRDETLRFGAGSPFVDVRLPCGGGIDLHVHVQPDLDVVRAVRRKLRSREPFSMVLPRGEQEPLKIAGSAIGARSETREGRFIRHFHPPTRLLLNGDGHEAATLTRLAVAVGIPTMQLLPFRGEANRVAVLEGSQAFSDRSDFTDLSVDPFTAVAFLTHDVLQETELIRAMTALKPFYIGMLGSKRTHARRMLELRNAGLGEADIQSIRGPIGLFGPTRTAADLAISVLAEIADARLRLDG
ncbi:MAG: XdhC family protein [Microvirga sp.]|jgi:xanthine dehydrogenase accessory factor|nr:XdhC family protein [Microvirga sp.]